MSMKRYNIFFFTLARSGFGYLMRLHNIIKECKKNNLTPLFICGAQYIPVDIANSEYDKIILPKMSFNHFTNKFDNIEYMNIYQSLIEELLVKWQPDYFVYTHIHDKLKLLESINTKSWNNTKRILLLRDIIRSPEKLLKSRDVNDWIQKLYFFDNIFIAGCQEIFDFTKNYSLPIEFNQKIKYIGYITNTFKFQSINNKYDIVISFGSGQHRDFHMKFVVKYLIPFFEKTQYSVIIVKGKYHQDIFENTNQKSNTIKIIDFIDRDTYLSFVSNSKLNIISGGYNSLVESLTIASKTLVLVQNELSEIVTRNKILNNLYIDVKKDFNYLDLKDIIDGAIQEKRIPIQSKMKIDGTNNFFKHLMLSNSNM